jgi:predicted DNA-binding transcriptional regulator AlpA
MEVLFFLGHLLDANRGARVLPATTKNKSPAGVVEDKPADVGVRLLTKRQVLDLTHVSYPTIWNWMRRGTFPRSRSLGHDGQKIVWLASEVEQWMTSLPVRELKAPDAA